MWSNDLLLTCRCESWWPGWWWKWWRWWTTYLISLVTGTWWLLWLTNVTWFTTHDLQVVSLSRSLFFLLFFFLLFFFLLFFFLLFFFLLFFFLLFFLFFKSSGPRLIGPIGIDVQPKRWMYRCQKTVSIPKDPWSADFCLIGPSRNSLIQSESNPIRNHCNDHDVVTRFNCVGLVQLMIELIQLMIELIQLMIELMQLMIRLKVSNLLIEPFLFFLWWNLLSLLLLIPSSCSSHHNCDCTLDCYSSDAPTSPGSGLVTWCYCIKFTHLVSTLWNWKHEEGKEYWITYTMNG